MNCNAKSLCITSIMLMTMSKNPALSQKVLENWLRLPESQELFAGLINTPFSWNKLGISMEVTRGLGGQTLNCSIHTTMSTVLLSH